MAGKFKMVWEQEEVTLDFEGDAGTPIDLLEVAGEKGREMLLEIMCINYPAEVEKMLAQTWHNPIRRRRVLGGTAQ
jgi:hypothetical protein